MARATPGYGVLRAARRGLTRLARDASRRATGFSADEQWMRVVMNRETRALVRALGPESLSVFEVSGDDWRGREAFKEYDCSANTHGRPELDICSDPLPGTYDLVIAEQVFEHLLWPYRAGRNLRAALRPGGHLLVTTPFLYRVHPEPHDCTRWTETGIRHFLAECGFDLDSVKTGSWGNRRCVIANLGGAVRYRSRLHSLQNDPDLPMVVWALARAD